MSEPQEVVEARMAQVKHKIMVMSGKGGVGKTTVAESRFLTRYEGFRCGIDGCGYMDRMYR